MCLSVLAGAINLTAWIEEDEGGNAWGIVSALVARGKLGYKGKDGTR
jgi:hypothetical protein